MNSENNYSMTKEISAMLGFMISFAALVIVYFYLYHSVEMNAVNDTFWGTIINNNISKYLAGLVIFFLLYIFTYKIFFRVYNNISMNNKGIGPWGVNGVALITFLLGIGLFMHWKFISQYQEVGCVNLEYLPVAYMFLGGVLIFGYFLYCLVNQFDLQNNTIMLIFCYSIFITFITNFINPYNCDGYSPNIASVTETIYNCYDCIPFDHTTSGIYGHYGLFFAIPLRIFARCTPRRISFLISVCAVIAQMSINYLVICFSPNRRITGLLILASIVRFPGIYPAISPIRTMMPLVMLAFMVYIMRRECLMRIGKIILWGNILVIISILWNLECGIAGIVGFGLFFCYWPQVESCGLGNIKKLKYLYCIMFAVCDVVFAILIVNIYNIICGGGLIFRDFFFPYACLDFSINQIMCVPPNGNHAWIYIVCLLLGTLIWGVIDKELNYRALLISMSAMGLIEFTYYMNEAHWGNLEIIHQLSIGLVALILNGITSRLHMKNRSQTIIYGIYKGIGLICAFICIFLSLYSYTDSITIAQRAQKGMYDFDKYSEDVDVLSKNLSNEVFGVGMGVNGLYHTLGWDNHLKMRDTGGMTMNGDEEAYMIELDEIVLHDSFIIGSNKYDSMLLSDILERDNRYSFIDEYSVSEVNYKLYSRQVEK